MNKYTVKYLLQLLFLVFSNIIYGQNLVKNPGFELKNACPTDRGQINYCPAYNHFQTAIEWVSPLNTTPDYFNRCGTANTIKLPNLLIDGYHEPHSGDACAGITMFSGAVYKDTSDYWAEYLETKLADKLIAGHTYYVSYYICPTYHAKKVFNIIAIDNIGARLTVNMLDTICKSPMYFLNGPADIQTPTGFFITDTTDWTLISGQYTATGGEQWLTLGSFYHSNINAKMLYLPINNSDTSNSACYMLVDDVCVIDMDSPITIDTTIYTPQLPIKIGYGYPKGQHLWYNGDTTETIEVNSIGKYYRQRWSDCSYYMDTFNVAEMPVESCVWLPTAFTPNNDGDNDYFGPGNIYCQPDFQNFSFVIYNRWGQIVFETFNPGIKWDGRYNGANMEIGVYHYVLKYTYGGSFSSHNQNPNTFKMLTGDVTLIR